jgi:hypothetical protein
MPRRFRDFAVAAFGVALLLAALALVDARVPGHVAGVAHDVSAGQWQPPEAVSNVLIHVASSPAADNVFVFAMVAAAVVLVFLMLRT